MWQVVAATATGQAHLRQGKGNEDVYCLATRLDGSLLVAVSDGAGSALYASEGAVLATTSAIALLSKVHLPVTEHSIDSLMLEVIQEVNTTLNIRAESQHLEVREFACTLLLAVLTPYYLVALQVGDGGIIGMNPDSAQRLTQPASGDYAGETVFVTSADYLDKTSCVVEPIGAFQGIAVLTDGLEPVATSLQTGEAFNPFFNPLLRFAKNKYSYEQSQALQAFLISERLTKRSHDDKTLVLVVRDG